jgi:hypothetical protein
MTFIADPKNVHRVFAPESGFDLTRFFRDVPKRWCVVSFPL